MEKASSLKAENTNEISAVLESLTNGVALFDVEKKVVLTNKAIQQMTGLPADGFYLNELAKLFGSGQVNIENQLEQALKTGKTTHVSEVSLLKYTYEIFITPIHESSGAVNGSVVVLHDISHYKNIDRMKSDFISTASHQLRTPMTGITWVAERLLKTEKLSDKGKDYLQDIRDSVQKLAQLVDTLLNVSRIEGSTIGIAPEDIDVIEDINGFLKESVPLVNKKSLNVKFSDHPPKLMVRSDKSAFRNIVQSLVSNAIEYTPEGGSIEISVREEDPNFVFTITDTGIGIPPEAQPTICDKFTRAENAKLTKTDGTGLGLFIAQQAAELLGGTITLVSPAPGRGDDNNLGTQFTVTLPLKCEAREGDKGLA